MSLWMYSDSPWLYEPCPVEHGRLSGSERQPKKLSKFLTKTASNLAIHIGNGITVMFAGILLGVLPINNQN